MKSKTDKELRYWLDKRMADIPKPIVVGKCSYTEEEQKEGEEILKSFIEKSRHHMQ